MRWVWVVIGLVACHSPSSPVDAGPLLEAGPALGSVTMLLAEDVFIVRGTSVVVGVEVMSSVGVSVSIAELPVGVTASTVQLSPGGHSSIVINSTADAPITDIHSTVVAVPNDGSKVFSAPVRIMVEEVRGSLDTTFGQDGFVDVGVAAFNHLVALGDGSMMGCGVDPSNAVVVARLLPDGSYDASWGAGGKVVIVLPESSYCATTATDSARFAFGYQGSTTNGVVIVEADGTVDAPIEAGATGLLWNGSAFLAFDGTTVTLGASPLVSPIDSDGIVAGAVSMSDGAVAFVGNSIKIGPFATKLIPKSSAPGSFVVDTTFGSGGALAFDNISSATAIFSDLNGGFFIGADGGMTHIDSHGATLTTWTPVASTVGQFIALPTEFIATGEVGAGLGLVCFRADGSRDGSFGAFGESVTPTVGAAFGPAALAADGTLWLPVGNGAIARFLVSP